MPAPYSHADAFLWSRKTPVSSRSPSLLPTSSEVLPHPATVLLDKKRQSNSDYLLHSNSHTDREIQIARQSSEKTPVYVVYAGDTPIAKVELESAGKNAHKFNKWTLGTISFGDFTKDLAEVKITAPTGADVYINGVQVTDTYKTESEVKFAPCLHVSDYVTVPTNDVYDVGQLIAKPDITAKLNGKDLTVDYDKKTGYTIYYPSDDELYKSMESRIYTIAEQYGAYIINRGSLSKLSSYMVGTAAEYVSDIPAIWAYLWGKSYTYQFNNESITNFRKYSDKCFSCDVYYDLYVDYKTGNTTYKTSLTYTFVKQNGTWMLADFLIN